MSGRSFAWLARIVILAVGLVAVLPGPVAAGKPIQFVDQRVDFECGLFSDEGYQVVLGVHLSEEFAEVGLAVWPAGADPEQEPPLVFAFGPAQYTVTDGTLTASVPLGSPVPGQEEPAPAGTATITATLDATGPVETVDERFRFANRWERIEGTTQPIVASGTVTLPEIGTIEFSGCAGSLSQLEVFRTNPTAFVGSDTYTEFRCELESEQGQAFVFGQLMEGHNFLSVFFLPAGSSEPLAGDTHFEAPDPLRFTVTIPLGEEATATLSATLTPTGERETYFLRAQGGRVKVVEEPLDVAGTLTFSTGQTFDLSGCDATTVDVHFAFHKAQAPRAGGTAPANDTQAGAVTLRPGSILRNVWTGGAAVAAEAPCLIDTPEGLRPLPFGRTVWYRIVGTGGEVTIDTAGSRFDTAIAVYRANGTLTQVACVDDVFLGRTFEGRTLQASVTFDTEPGVVYYIQVGGFGAEYGRLRLRVT